MRLATAGRRIRALSPDVLEPLIGVVSNFGARVAAATGTDEADCRAAAVDGLLYAWETYDPGLGVAWESWATRQVRYCLRDVMRGRNRQKHYRAFIETFRLISVNDKDANDIEVEDTIPDPSRLEARMEASAKALLALNHMNPAQEVAVRMKAEGYNRREVGLVLGLTESQVTRIYQDVRRIVSRIEDLDR